MDTFYFILFFLALSLIRPCHAQCNFNDTYIDPSTVTPTVLGQLISWQYLALMQAYIYTGKSLCLDRDMQVS